MLPKPQLLGRPKTLLPHLPTETRLAPCVEVRGSWGVQCQAPQGGPDAGPTPTPESGLQQVPPFGACPELTRGLPSSTPQRKISELSTTPSIPHLCPGLLVGLLRATPHRTPGPFLLLGPSLLRVPKFGLLHVQCLLLGEVRWGPLYCFRGARGGLSSGLKRRNADAGLDTGLDAGGALGRPGPGELCLTPRHCAPGHQPSCPVPPPHSPSPGTKPSSTFCLPGSTPTS